MATLKDIAQRAGVTATTVSRVINNRGYISEGTRKKVYAAMEEMHYQPNELARAFSKQYTNTIGLIVPHISHPFFTKVISNIESSAAEKGFKLLLCNSKEQPEKEQDYLDMCMSNRVAGIVLCSKYVQTREFRKMNIPVVNLERGEDDDTISVQCDNYQGGKLAAEHLIECGCKNLLHFGGVAGKDMPADRRADGFSDVCKRAGIPYRILVSDRLLYGSMHYRIDVGDDHEVLRIAGGAHPVGVVGRRLEDVDDLGPHEVDGAVLKAAHDLHDGVADLGVERAGG